MDGDSMGGPDAHDSVGSWKRSVEPGCKCLEKEDHTCLGLDENSYATIFSVDENKKI
jgi:hypothetical protein